MRIHSVYDAAFRRYGQVHEWFPVTELLGALSKTPVTDAVVYTASDPGLEALAAAQAVSQNLYGGMPVQIGWCNGHNTKMDCLEYHRNSELVLGDTAFILLVACLSDVTDGKLDTSLVEAYYVPRGVLVECYATTLHYAPCHLDPEEGFRVMIALPRGTNAEKPGITPLTQEDRLLWACNKWVLAHEASEEAAQGAWVGLVGQVVDIAWDIERITRILDKMA